MWGSWVGCFFLLTPVVAQQLAAFDSATASSVYSTKSFGADLAGSESSGSMLLAQIFSLM